MTKIHVLEIVGNAIVGGMERYVQEMVRQLSGDRFCFTCLAPFESPFTSTLRELGCEVFITPMAEDPIWRSIQVAVEVVRSRHIDLLHAHLAKASVLAGLVARLTDTPVLATVHERYANDQVLGIARLTGTHLLTVCQEAYFHAQAQGIPAKQISLIRNGVDTDRFVPRRAPAQVREALGIPADVPVVGCVARLSPEKGVDRFIRAAEHVHRKRPDVHFVVIGSGYQHAMLTKLAAELGLADCIHIPGVAMDTTTLYPALDVVVQTSRTEGMPLVLLEAMACARPVVAMSVGGVAEIVEAGVTGLLVTRDNWRALAGTLVELLEDPERMSRMGSAGRIRVEAHFRLSTTMQRTGQLFQQLVRSNVRDSTRELVAVPVSAGHWQRSTPVAEPLS